MRTLAKNVLLKFKLNKYKGKQGNNLHNSDLYFGVLFIREKNIIFFKQYFSLQIHNSSESSTYSRR